MSTTTVEIPADVPGQVALILQTLQDVVNEAGHDFVYQKYVETCEFECYYVHPETGQPDCIAGRVLHRLGVSLELLQRHEGTSCSGLEGLTPFGKEALLILSTAQRAQDTQHTYGVALERARTGAAELLARRSA